MLRIVVDAKKCAGLGLCEAEDPEVFQVQDEGQVRLLCERPGPERRAAIEAAVDACPTGALSLIED